MHDNTLKRGFGFFSATMVVVASMVGTGIFTTSGFIAEELGDPFMMLICWVAGGVFALCGALCYGELGAMYPEAGGEYVFLRESFGKWMGFLSGWISLIVGFSAPIAASSIAFSTYLFSSCSVSLGGKWCLTLGGMDVVTVSPQGVLAIGVIIAFSFIHCRSLSAGKGFQNGLTLFKIGFIIIFILAGFFLGDGASARFSEHTGGDVNITQGKFVISLIFVTFAYSGWNGAAYLGGEIKNPRRNIPLALFSGTFLVTVLYILLNIVYIYALPGNMLSGTLEVGIKSATSLFGHDVGKYFGGAISICILSVISALIMTGPRVYYAMAKDGVFFRIFSRISRAHGTPVHAILFQAVIAVVMVLTTSFDKLLIYTGFTLSIFVLLTVAGMMLLRRKTPDMERHYRTFGYPATPLLFILGNLWIIYFSIQTRPVASVFGLTTIGLGGLLYLYFRSRNPDVPRE